MQPLTPAERREIERIKLNIVELRQGGHISTAFNDSNRELWLKVLTMALECNEALETAWKQRYDAPPERVCVKEFDDAKRRLRR